MGILYYAAAKNYLVHGFIPSIPPSLSLSLSPPPPLPLSVFLPFSLPPFFLSPSLSLSLSLQLEEVITVCHDHPQLVFSHRAVLHTLLVQTIQKPLIVDILPFIDRPQVVV